METPTTYGHVASLAIFDPATAPQPLGYEDVRALIESRLHLVAAVPAPAGRRARSASTTRTGSRTPTSTSTTTSATSRCRRRATASSSRSSRCASRPVTSTARRPLWEMYVIEGLEGGYVAELTKIHHSCIDGVAGRRDPRRAARHRARAGADAATERRRGSGSASRARARCWRAAWSARRPARASGSGSRATRCPAFGTVMRNFALSAPGVKRRDDVLSRPAVQAPRTALNGTITPHRRFAFGSLPMSSVKNVKNALGATVNDVVMALCAGALRRWLIDHDALPDLPLLAMVPVSVRDESEQGAGGNRVSAMVAVLPTDEPDAGRRLEAMQGEMSIAKSEHGALPAALLQDFAQFTPPSVLGTASRVAARARLMDRVGLPFNVVISNVPGPQFPLYTNGARMEGIYPISAIVDGVGLNMTLMSYNGNLDFGLVADREMVPDIWSLIDYLGEELETLEKLAAI